MSEQHSVTDLLHKLEEDDSDAARQIWERFAMRLVGAANRQLKGLPRRAVDEEDVVASAFEAFFRGVKEQRFPRLENREDLWQVLAMLTERKAIAVIRKELADKRGGGLNRGESVFEKLVADSSADLGIDRISDPDPYVVEVFTQEVREMLNRLGDELLRKIAVSRLEGYTNAEIAAQMNISLRAVERKLSLIREKWNSTS